MPPWGSHVLPRLSKGPSKEKSPLSPRGYHDGCQVSWGELRSRRSANCFRAISYTFFTEILHMGNGPALRSPGLAITLASLASQSSWGASSHHSLPSAGLRLSGCLPTAPWARPSFHSCHRSPPETQPQASLPRANTLNVFHCVWDGTKPSGPSPCQYRPCSPLGPLSLKPAERDSSSSRIRVTDQLFGSRLPTSPLP